MSNQCFLTLLYGPKGQCKTIVILGQYELSSGEDILLVPNFICNRIVINVIKVMDINVIQKNCNPLFLAVIEIEVILHDTDVIENKL